jgi:hypothetical protein
VVPVQAKHGTLRFVSKLHFNRVSRIPERILVPAPHFNVVCSDQRRISRNRFNDLLFIGNHQNGLREREAFMITMLKHGADSIVSCLRLELSNPAIILPQQHLL